MSLCQVICPLPASPSQLSPVLPLTAGNEPSLPSVTAAASSISNKVTVSALYDFEMKDEDKEDCLKFKKVRCHGVMVISGTI